MSSQGAVPTREHRLSHATWSFMLAFVSSRGGGQAFAWPEWWPVESKARRTSGACTDARREGWVSSPRTGRYSQRCAASCGLWPHRHDGVLAASRSLRQRDPSRQSSAARDITNE